MIEIRNVNDLRTLITYHMTEVKSIDKIIDKLSYYGNVDIKYQNNLLLFNYNYKAQKDARWNNFEIMSRGLLIDPITNEVIAYPFDKFFNWNENNRKSNDQISYALEKLDGSLGILYRHDNQYKISTRGSLNSEQSNVATEILNNNYNINKLDNSLTLMFEIIYPENRGPGSCIIDYNNIRDIFLIGARNRFTYKLLNWKAIENIAKEFKFKLPKIYKFNSIDDIIKQTKIIPWTIEGWVVYFDDGQIFKFKGTEYCSTQKFINGINFKWAVEQHKLNQSLNHVYKLIPDEFYNEVKNWEKLIENTIKRITDQIEIIFEQCPKQSRKDFALYIMSTPQFKQFQSMLFNRFDNKDYKYIIYKNIENLINYSN